VSVRRRAFGDVADLTPVLDLIRAMPTASRHVLDFGWRLTVPAIAAAGTPGNWQGAGVEFRDDDQDRQALVAAHGFVHNARAYDVYLECQLDVLPPPPRFLTDSPSGRWAVPPEAAAYAQVHRAAFGSEAMTALWRERTIGTPRRQRCRRRDRARSDRRAGGLRSRRVRPDPHDLAPGA